MNSEKFNEGKCIRAGIRFGKEEYEHLKELAKQSHLNLSDYIRHRLFEDELPILSNEKIEDHKGKFACDHDRELMKLSMRMYLFIKELSRATLSEDTFKKCNAVATQALKEWGYE